MVNEKQYISCKQLVLHIVVSIAARQVGACHYTWSAPQPLGCVGEDGEWKACVALRVSAKCETLCTAIPVEAMPPLVAPSNF